MLSVLAQTIFFVTQIVVANVLGNIQFGDLAYGIAIGNYGQIAVRYGMDRTMVRELVHHPDQTAGLVKASYVLRAILLSVFIVCLMALRLSGLDRGLSLGVAIVAVAWSLKSLDLEAVYDAWLQMRRHSVYNMLQRATCIVLMLSLLFWRGRNATLTDVGLIYVIATLVYLVVQHRWAYSSNQMNTAVVPVWPLAKKILRNNVWVASSGLVGISLGSMAQIILKNTQGPKELGIYAAGSQFLLGAGIIINSMIRIGNPAVASITRADTPGSTVRSVLMRYGAAMLLLTGGIASFMIFFPGLLMSWCFSEEYAAGADVVRILGVNCLMYSIVAVASQYVVGLRLEWQYFAGMLSGAVASVILSLTLIPRFGINGAALAVTVSQGLSAAVLVSVLVRHLPPRKGGECRVG